MIDYTKWYSKIQMWQKQYYAVWAQCDGVMWLDGKKNIQYFFLHFSSKRSVMLLLSCKETRLHLKLVHFVVPNKSQRQTHKSAFSDLYSWWLSSISRWWTCNTPAFYSDLRKTVRLLSTWLKTELSFLTCCNQTVLIKRQRFIAVNATRTAMDCVAFSWVKIGQIPYDYCWTVGSKEKSMMK